MEEYLFPKIDPSIKWLGVESSLPIDNNNAKYSTFDKGCRREIDDE